jgi:lysophospholipase L1-like esterase
MRIVCFGDSVTRGISLVQGRLRIVKENYPVLLQRTLDKLGIEVLNRGVFNDNSDRLVERLESDVLDTHPDYVLIEIGGNDCNFRWDEVALHPEADHEPIVPVDRYLENVKKIVNDIRVVGAVPILMNLLPLDPVRYYKHIADIYGDAISHWIALCGGIEHWHGMYNRSLQQCINSWNALTIDVRGAFKHAGDLKLLLSDDGIHPTPTGYDVMSRVIDSALSPRFS